MTFNNPYAATTVNIDPYGAYQNARNAGEDRDYVRQQRQRQEDVYGANVARAGAINSGDYAGARNISAKIGDVPGVQAVQGIQQSELWQRAREADAALQSIAQMPVGQRVAAYTQWRAAVHAQAERMGINHPEIIAQFDSTYPQTANDQQIAAAAQASHQRLTQQALSQQSPDEYLTQEGVRAGQIHTFGNGGLYLDKGNGQYQIIRQPYAPSSGGPGNSTIPPFVPNPAGLPPPPEGFQVDQ